MEKKVAAMLALVILGLWGHAAFAQPSCSFRLRLAQPDGKLACLTDYSLARVKAAGLNQDLQSLLPPRGFYAVAASGGYGSSCPLTAALVAEPAGVQASATTREAIAHRAATAVQECKGHLEKAGATSCDCSLVLLDGVVQVPKATFDQRFLLAQAAPPEVAVAPPVATVRPSALPPQVAGSGAPKLTARALVIGNSRYTNFGALPNPGRDARAMAAKLRSFGIEVDLVLDAERDDMIHALNEYSRRAAGKDVNLLFYAGHGVQVEGINYLIPVNMRADGISAGYVKLAGISLNATLDYLPAKTRLVFLDACRDNPATRSLAGTRGVAAGLAPVDAASGTLIAYATRDGATAADGDGLNSPYTTALLQHLDQPLDISLVLRQVRQTVLRLTSGRQEPWEYGSLVGDQIVLPLMAR
jgi:hypothetical protein